MGIFYRADGSRPARGIRGRLARRLGTIAIAGAAIVGTQVVTVFSAPAAHADDCAESSEWTSTTRANSNPFNASIDCGGVWAIHFSTSDYLRGIYYKDGDWQQSTYGWQWVTQSPSSDKIIGNTVPGRRLKAISQTFTGYCRCRY